jgi:hypothetical protein
MSTGSHDTPMLQFRPNHNRDGVEIGFGRLNLENPISMLALYMSIYQAN